MTRLRRAPRRSHRRGCLAGRDLAGLLLGLHLPERDGDAADQRVQRAHEAADGRGDDADELSVEHFARGQARERADLLDVELGAAHETALERQQLRCAPVVGDGLGRAGDVAADERQGGGAREERLQRLGADLVGGALGERVLDDLEGRVGLAQLGPQLGDLRDGDAAVVDGEDRLGLVDVGGDLGDRHCLLVSVHGAPVPVLRRWPAAGGLWWPLLWMTLGGDGSRGRLLEDFTCL